MTIHIFNPDTDYALAADRRYYTPPAHVVSVRRSLALTPALYATPGDFILLLDCSIKESADLEHYEEAMRKGIKIADMYFLKSHRKLFYGSEIRPWGWNRAIAQFARDYIDNPAGIPSEVQIDALRNLSHRRTTISMQLALADLTADEIEIPKEVFNVDEAMQSYHHNHDLYFKAPWSSSGRGILLTNDLEDKHVEPWLRGVICRQGSVMMEKAYNRKLDFATEWWLDGENAKFLGYSVFNTSRRGKYHSNIIATQKELNSLIRQAAPQWSDLWLEEIKKALINVAGAKYKGPLGIDMLVTENGNVNPCVEINFRMTMGIAAIKP